ncbi:MAG: hypothetical protein JWR85_1303 [Marmoricola sp.]|nr:hypothetical protein [Marmoricola sp.]
MSTPGPSLRDPRSLLGTWQLARTIEDRLVGEQSLVDGTLELTEVSADRIRWREQGHWHRAAGDVEVHRSLWLARDDPAGEWWVRFEDERDFHPWTPGDPVVHPCGADTYSGVVRGTPQQWTVLWDVTGPGKDYLMSTELSRVT